MHGLEQIKSINTWAAQQKQIQEGKCQEHRGTPDEKCVVCSQIAAALLRRAVKVFTDKQ